MAKRTVLGTCPQDCPDNCSMLIDVEDGRVTGVRGNPDHLFTRGGLCLKVNNYEERTYSSERVLYPLRRTGPKGAGEFERITWTRRWTRSRPAGARSSTSSVRKPSCRTAFWAPWGCSTACRPAMPSSTAWAPRSPSGPIAVRGFYGLYVDRGRDPRGRPETIVHAKYIVPGQPTRSAPTSISGR